MAGLWRKTLVYLGFVDEEELDDYGYEDYEEEERAPQRSTSVRRLSEPEYGRDTRDVREPRRDSVVRPVPAPSARFHLVSPGAFNDAQEVGDKYRQGHSVLMNLQSVEPDLARRLVDFASGLVYGVGGSLQPVAERVYLLTPPGVQVSAEDRRRFLEERGFFNQG